MLNKGFSFILILLNMYFVLFTAIFYIISKDLHRLRICIICGVIILRITSSKLARDLSNNCLGGRMPINKLGSNKPPILSTDTDSSSGATAANTNFRGRNASVAGTQQSAAFIPSSDVRTHSSIPSSEQKPGIAKRYAKLQHDYGADSRQPQSIERRASDSQYAKLEGQYSKFQHDYGADSRQPQSIEKRASDTQYAKLGSSGKKPSEATFRLAAKPKTSSRTSAEYDYAYTEANPRTPRRTSAEYDYAYTEVNPKPLPDEGEYSSLQHDYGKQDVRAPKPPAWLANREQQSTDISQSAAKSESSESSSTEYDDVVIQSKPSQPKSSQHEVDTNRRRMPSPPPPPIPARSYKAPPLPPRPAKPPPSISEHSDKSQSASQSPPPLPPRPAKPTTPPPLYSRADKPSVPPPLPPRTTQGSPKSQQSVAGTSESNMPGGIAKKADS